jgi:large conductance mechanosensitive channel
MLMDKQILNYGIAFVIGQSFGSLISSFIRDIITPLLFSISSITNSSSTKIQSGPGWIIFTNISDNTKYISASGAINNGIQVIQYNVFLSEFLNFIMSLITVYWVTSCFIEYRKKKCKFCIEDIDVSATKCPHCISIV